MTDGSKLIAELKKARDILLITHINPDGDAVGSTLALKLALEKLGKNVSAVCDGRLSSRYGLTREAGELAHPDSVTGPFELTVALDCADLLRLGASQRLFDGARLTACIDHHRTNPFFADINIVREASSTGELVYPIIAELTEPDAMICKLIYVAISTDTGGFMYSNTSPAAFEVMSRICDKFDYESAARELFATRSYDDTLIIAKTIESIRLYEEGAVAVGHLDLKDIANLPQPPDYECAVTYLTNISTVKVAVFLRQLAPGAYKVSLRSKGKIDVAALCEIYGGGGHVNAAGCKLDMPLLGCVSELMPRIKALL